MCGQPSPRFSMRIASLPKDWPTAHEDDALDLNIGHKSEVTEWKKTCKAGAHFPLVSRQAIQLRGHPQPAGILPVHPPAA